jgi:hypothetical protein
MDFSKKKSGSKLEVPSSCVSDIKKVNPSSIIKFLIPRRYLIYYIGTLAILPFKIKKCIPKFKEAYKLL